MANDDLQFRNDLMLKPAIEGFRLSSQQRHLWLLQQHVTGFPFRTRCVLEIKGGLEISSLTAAIETVTGRHEILSTVFRNFPGMRLPVQVIAACNAAAIDHEDLSWMSESEAHDHLKKLLEGAAESQFNFERGPLAHVRVVQLSAHIHVVSFDISGLCADFTTLKNFTREVGVAYESLVSGRRIPVSDEGVAYADFAQWQCEILESDETASGRRFWQQKNLAGRLNYELWCERRTPPTSSFRPRFCRYIVEPQTLEKIEKISRLHETSPDLLMLAAWSVLLGRFAGRTDLVVGCACDSRRYAELENVYGAITQYLPLEFVLNDSLTLIELLERVNATFQEAQEWQECFDWAQLTGARDAQEPYCSFGFDFERLPGSARFAGSSFSFRDLQSFLDRFDLRLSCLQDGEMLLVNLYYDAGRFQEEVVGRLLNCYGLLLEEAIENPGGILDELPVVGAEERRELLLDFNGARYGFDQRQCLHRMIEEQAAAHPDRIAVVCGLRQLSYAELNARANLIANRLLDLGVKPGDIVGVCLERSVELIVGILGILKAGGGYLPFDPDYPVERLGMMIDDARASIVICSGTTKSIFGGLQSVQLNAPLLIEIEELYGSWMLRTDNPVSHVSGQNTAYVIYTSGSTGKPKGVVVTHDNLAHSTRVRLLYYREPVSSFLLLSSCSFDSSIAGIFGTLCQGGSLFIPREGEHHDAVSIVRLINCNRITHILCLPSLYMNLIDQSGTDRLTSLRAVILAGEATARDLVELHHDITPEAQLFNEYGPTEATVWSTVYECRPQGPERVPIGSPITNVRVFVLTPRLNLLPIGVPGEVYLGGDGLTQGYLNRPAVTAERFIPDPFAGSPGDRVYKTGDFARFLSNGTLEFLGRLDQQVKIRGVRIELGEIEAVLGQSPDIRDVVVAAREHPSGEKVLVAYIVAQVERASLTHEVRRSLEEKLPSHLVPSAFVRLDSLPLTASGKIDRQSLPDPDWNNPAREHDLIAPRTAVEEILAGIWAEVLGAARVGIQDNFFAVGGHSLNATRVMAKVCQVFQVELAVRHLFEAPTVAALAELIVAAANTNQNEKTSAIGRAVDVTQIPLSLAQERLWFLDQLEPESVAYHVPGAFSLNGSLNLHALEQSLQEVIRRHEILRTTFLAVDGRPIQAIGAAARWMVPLIDLQGIAQAVSPAVVSELAVAEATHPFNLAEGPLLRVTLLRLDAESHVVLFTTHHIISDGWSMGILIRELRTLYDQILEGQPSRLPEPNIQYKDFAVWQRERLQGEALKSQLDYWRSRLENHVPFELPGDYFSSATPSSSGALQPFELTGTLTEELRALSRQQGVTLFMTLLAAFDVLLHWYSGQEDVAVGTSIANRSHQDTEGLIGFFVNTLVLRVSLSQSSTFRELLDQVRAVCLGAYAHQDLPFMKLVEYLRPERVMNRQPLFQILFDLNNASLEQLEFPGLMLARLPVDRTVARFDLAVTLWESPQGLKGTIEYRTDLFRPATISRLIKHYRALLEEIVANVDYIISAQDIIFDDESESLTMAFNADLELNS